jgi:signal transduction histidine kinase/ligand-binding sensor domain-containing protein
VEDEFETTHSNHSSCFVVATGLSTFNTRPHRCPMMKPNAPFSLTRLPRRLGARWILGFAALCGGLLVAERLLAAEPTPVDDSYSARVWQAEDGLPENRVIGVVQSPDGFLWVATQGGLVRFDGIRFQRVDLAQGPGTIAGTMRVLILDRNGRIWLAKDEGGAVFCFEGAQVRTLSPVQGLPINDTPRAMAVDGDGALWISYSSSKIIRYNPDGQVEDFTTAAGLPAGSGVCWLASGRDGILWFAKNGRVGVFRNGQFKVLENFGSAALQLTPARSGGVWICVDTRIIKFDEGQKPLELGRINPAGVRNRDSLGPMAVLEDRSGIVWVGTVSAGLYRCDSNSVARVEVASPGILSLAEDREGNLWVGTRGGGLNQVRRRMIAMINSTAGLPFEVVQSVCQDSTGALWAVGGNGVLARNEAAKWVVQAPATTGQESYVTCVTATTNGPVWIGTRGGGLYRWTEGTFHDSGLRTSLQGKSLRSLLMSRSGDLWIGTDASDVLYRLRGEELKLFNLPPGRRFIRAMTEDSLGNIWVGASDGLLVCVTGDTLVNKTTLSAAVSIRCLYGAANGDVWIGFAGAGVGRLRAGQLTLFTTERGLPNDYVSQILRDERDSLWFASNQGIFRVRERDFEDLSNGTVARISPVVYGRSEGHPGLQASFDFCPASLRGANERLYFSMLSGLAEVQFDQARINFRPPEVFIERVTGDERTFAVYQVITATTATNATAPLELRNHDERAEVRFPPGLKQVRFEFTALSFAAPENVQFRYQLEGLDVNWVEAGPRRFASYTHLPPGRYRFKVIACNNDGVWNKVGDTISVVFEPFIWETLWFKIAATVLSFGALSGLLVLGLRRRHRVEMERVEHQRALEVERTRIARDLHDDLGVGLTEIGLLGDLAGTSHGLPEGSRERLQEITGRARTLAASLDEIVWAINPANDTSQSLVDYFFPYAQRLLGSASIRCRLEVIEPLPAGNLSAEDRHEFFHAYKEALNNIIRHAGATQVQITFSAAAGDLMIRVADNGCGLEERGNTGAHHGLPGMRERLLRLGGRCDITSEGGSGTTVTFIIPVQSETKS